MGLEIKNVSKSYGTKKVVDNISISVTEPSVFGLLGTNGAGKTTTIRMLLGILKKDSGSILWNNHEVSRDSVNFGYLPEERGIYPKVKVREQLMYFASLKGMNAEDASKSIEKWAEELKITEYLDYPAEKLSKGNQQKVQFMTAVIHDPILIVLDEPFSGLDPVNSEILKNVIIKLVKMGKYIIMSAHEMHTIEEFCNDIVILNRSKVVLSGNLKTIRNSYSANRVFIEVSKNIDSYVKELKLKVENMHDNCYTIKINNEEEAHKLLSKLVKDKILVNKFEIQKPSLNDIFIEKVGATHE